MSGFNSLAWLDLSYLTCLTCLVLFDLWLLPAWLVYHIITLQMSSISCWCPQSTIDVLRQLLITPRNDWWFQWIADCLNQLLITPVISLSPQSAVDHTNQLLMIPICWFNPNQLFITPISWFNPNQLCIIPISCLSPQSAVYHPPISCTGAFNKDYTLQPRQGNSSRSLVTNLSSIVT